MKRLIVIVAVGAMMMLPSAAFAGSSSSTVQAYNKQTVAAKKVLAAQASRTPASTETTQTGSLPFTGLDVGALGAGALVLLGAGVALRRLSTNQRD